ncbi:F-box protein At3g08750-like [Panicum virgatum]|uniref:F-box protein At3g08750-like n=1 Tax=Panicum virgatum TaxID=38727 RepID=UPI0019D5ED02|nr:F-box protein At3g08750-like [Panicum virgatum]
MLIRNILARVPPSSATRFKVVCKNWHSMIADDSYARNHLAVAAPVRSVLLYDGDAPCPVTVVDEAGAARLAALRPRLGKPRHGFTVQNCCGALACLRSGQRDAELLNPATGESLGLGHFFRRGPPTTWTHAADHLPWYCLGRCAAGIGEYKIVRLDVRLPSSRRPEVTCEVLPLGRESWDSTGCFAPEWKKVASGK